MPGGKAKLLIEVAFKDSFSKAMKGVSRFLVGEQGRIGAAFKRTTRTVFNLRNAIVGGLAAVVTKDLASAYATQEAAEQRLANAMRLTGEHTAEAEANFHAFASQLQNTTTVGDEATLQMLSVAKAMRLSNEQAKALVTASVDMAAATGKGVQEAFRQLLKTTGGMAGELAEVIPAVKELTAEELKAGKAIEVVGRQFAGFAAGEAQTFGGQLTQIGNLWGDLKEKAGAFIATIFNSGLGEWIKTTLVVLNDTLAEASAGFAEGGPAADRWAKALITVLKDVMRSTAAVADGFRLMLKPIMVLRQLRAQEHIDAIATAQERLQQAQKALADESKVHYDTIGGELQKVVKIQGDFIAHLSQDMPEALLRVNNGLTVNQEQLAQMSQALQRLRDDADAVDGAFHDDAEAAEQTRTALETLNGVFAEVEQRLKNQRTHAKAAGEAYVDMSWSLGAAVQRMAEAQRQQADNAIRVMLSNSFQGLDEVYEEALARQQQFGAALEGEAGMTSAGLTGGLDPALESWQDYFDRIQTMSAAWAATMQHTIDQVAGGVANIVGDAVGQVLRGEITSTKEMGKALQEMFTDLAISIVQDMIKISIQMAIMVRMVR